MKSRGCLLCVALCRVACCVVLCRCHVSKEGYAAMTEALMRYAGGKVVAVLEVRGSVLGV